MNEIKKITRSTIIYLLGSVLSKLVAFFMLRLYTTYISPSEFGKYDLSITYVTLITSIIFLDIWCGIMRYMFDYSKKNEKYSVVLSGGIIFLASIGIYTIVFYVFAINFDLNYKIFVYFYGLSLCFQNFFGYLSRAFGFDLRFAVSGIFSTLANALANIILIVFLGMNYEALYISYIIGVVAQCIIIEQKIQIRRSIKKVKINFKITKDIFKFSLPLSINSASYWLLTSYGTIVISQELGAVYNGYYAIASKFSMIITLVSIAFSMAWQEMAFTKTTCDLETGIFYSKATDLYIKLLFCGYILIIPIIYIIFPFFVSNNYIEAKTIIPMYVLATVMSILSTFLGNILTAFKRTKNIFTSTLIAGIVNILAIYLLINRYGLIAAPTALFLGFFVNCVTRIFLIKKILKYKFYGWKLIYVIPVTIIVVGVFQTDKLIANIFLILISSCVSIGVFRVWLHKFINGIFLKLKRKKEVK